MVTYITRIIMPADDGPKDSPAAARRGAMLKLLASRGFVINRRKNRIVAESGSMEAQAVKRYLLEHGFRADEFQVYLEYTRQWGML